MLRTIRMAALALGVSSGLYASSGLAFAEAEYLRLRPLKEPSTCVEADSGVKCPAVKAPRINKRVSTIPGVQHPDHGRPPVINNPLGTRSTPPIQIFGNPSISGN
jgi:hypothetical protein